MPWIRSILALSIQSETSSGGWANGALAAQRLAVVEVLGFRAFRCLGFRCLGVEGSGVLV